MHMWKRTDDKICYDFTHHQIYLNSKCRIHTIPMMSNTSMMQCCHGAIAASSKLVVAVHRHNTTEWHWIAGYNTHLQINLNTNGRKWWWQPLPCCHERCCSRSSPCSATVTSSQCGGRVNSGTASVKMMASYRKLLGGTSVRRVGAMEVPSHPASRLVLLLF